MELCCLGQCHQPAVWVNETVCYINERIRELSPIPRPNFKKPTLHVYVCEDHKAKGLRIAISHPWPCSASAVNCCQDCTAASQ
jgi:hypothetical protein